MNPVNRFLHTTIQPTEKEADRLATPRTRYNTVEVKPPQGDISNPVPAAFIKGITELQSKWRGFKNTSPITAFEIRRTHPDELTLQFATPTKRLERKLRTQLTNQIPGVRFEEGTSGIPATTDHTIAGGLLTAGRRDWYPLQHDFTEPPLNAVISTLHRHAMQDTTVIIQVLFQPVTGKPVRRWYWRRRAYQRIGFLRKEKEKLWGSRRPTPREKQQANAIEQKAGTNRFHTCIRILVIGAADYSRSRIKEVCGGFNIYENPETGQYLNTETIRTLRRSRILDFAKTVRDRRFNNWSRSFQTSTQELAALVSLPSRDQANLRHAQP